VIVTEELARAMIRYMDALAELAAVQTERSPFTHHHSLMRAVTACRRDVEALTHGKRDEGVWR
jgi:hypothetical protein